MQLSWKCENLHIRAFILFLNVSHCFLCCVSLLAELFHTLSVFLQQICFIIQRELSLPAVSSSQIRGNLDDSRGLNKDLSLNLKDKSLSSP